MAKVYILQDRVSSARDFSPAEEYGELVLLFDHHISPYHLNQCIAQLRSKLEYATEDDWIILVGHPVMIAMAGVVWTDIVGDLKALYWDQRANKYIPVRIDPDDDKRTYSQVDRSRQATGSFERSQRRIGGSAQIGQRGKRKVGE